MSKGFPTYEIPAEMRDFAEKSVEQARKAFDGFLGAATKTLDTFDGSTGGAHAGATEVTRKTLGYAEQNIAAAFDLAHKLVRSRDVQEAMQHQADYLKKQLAALQEQVKEFSATAQQAATDAVKRKG